MGRKLTQGLEWLKPNNPEQLRWAATYLAARGLLEKHEHPDNRPFGEQVVYEDLVRVGRRLQKPRALIQDMKAAWRQKEYRESTNGRKTCSFTLKATTKSHLKELAGDGSESAFLESLIDKAYKAKCRRKQKPDESNKQTLQGDRHRTLVDIRETLTGVTTQPDDPAAPELSLAGGPMGEPAQSEQPLGDHTPETPNEKTAASSPELVNAGENETSLDQEDSNFVLPNAICDGQALTTSTNEPEQETAVDACLEPIESPPRAQTELQTPEWNMRLQRPQPQKMRRNMPERVMQKIQSTMPYDEHARDHVRAQISIKDILAQKRARAMFDRRQVKSPTEDGIHFATPETPNPEPDQD